MKEVILIKNKIKNKNTTDVKEDRAAQDVVPGAMRREVFTTAETVEKVLTPHFDFFRV